MEITNILKSKNIPNLCLLYGSEGYLKRQFRDNLINILMPEPDSMNFTKFINKTGKVDEANSILDELISTAQTFPMFKDKRVILCENTGFFKNAFPEFASFIKEVPDFTYIIFVENEINRATGAYKTVSKLGFSEEYNMPKRPSLIKWVENKVKAADLSINRDALIEFVDRTSTNMDNMDCELSKLISYCMNSSVITVKDIDEICIASYEEQIFNIINAIAKKDKPLALKEYAFLYGLRTSPRSILALLSTRFSQILNIKQGYKSGMNEASIAKNLGINSPYAYKKSAESARIFSERSLKSILDLSAEYHRKMNTGLLDEQTGIEMFILKSLKA